MFSVNPDARVGPRVCPEAVSDVRVPFAMSLLNYRFRLPQCTACFDDASILAYCKNDAQKSLVECFWCWGIMPRSQSQKIAFSQLMFMSYDSRSVYALQLNSCRSGLYHRIQMTKNSGNIHATLRPNYTSGHFKSSSGRMIATACLRHPICDPTIHIYVGDIFCRDDEFMITLQWWQICEYCLNETTKFWSEMLTKTSKCHCLAHEKWRGLMQPAV